MSSSVSNGLTFCGASANGKTVRIQKLPTSQKRLSHLKISLCNTQRDLSLSTTQVKKVVSFLLKDLKISTNEVIFHFVSERKICLLHKEFFNDPSPTDCITFPLDSPSNKDAPHHILGEAFICPKTAVNYAKVIGIDPHDEIYRYLTHCILHLIGYTDTQPIEKAKMKRKERACLKKLAKARLISFIL